MGYNRKLINARNSKMDNFFTKYETIEKEVIHYKDFFINKTVYCNCDDYTQSNFFMFFKNNFNEFKLKKVICSWFNEPVGGVCEYDGTNTKVKELDFNGDFRNTQFENLILEADIIVTNPPFSLFRDFIEIMMAYKKQFIVLGNLNAVKYKNIFPLIKENKLFLGKSIHSHDVEFIVPEEFFNKEKTKNFRMSEGKYMVRVPSIRWYTNIMYEGVNEYDLKLTKTFEEESYLKYDDYQDIINCNKVLDIPYDYNGVMGVPINFIDKYNSKKFEIVGILRAPTINEKAIYDRILIKKR